MSAAECATSGLRDFVSKLKAESERRRTDDESLVNRAAAAEVRGAAQVAKPEKLVEALERLGLGVDGFERLVAEGRTAVATAEQLRTEKEWSSWWQSEFPEKAKARDELRAKLQTVEAEIATCAHRVGSNVMSQLMRAVNTFRAGNPLLASLLFDEEGGR